MTLWLAGCASSTPPYGPRAPLWGGAEPHPRVLPAERAALDQVAALLAPRGMGPPTLDARLTRAASALNHRRALDRTREACEVSPAVVEAALSWAGIYERPSCNRCWWSRKEAATVPPEALQGLADCAAGSGEILVGIATLLDEERTFVTVLAARRQVTLDPTPRAVGTNAALEVHAVVPPGGSRRALVAWPGRPVDLVELTPVATGNLLKLALPALQSGKPGHVTILDIHGAEAARFHVDPPGLVMPGAFGPELHVSAQPAPMALTNLRASVQQLRISRGGSTPQVSGVLEAVAQEEANQASAGRGWMSAPVSEPRARQAAEAAASVRVFKLWGPTAEDLGAQLDRNPVALWALTRAVPTLVGVGMAATGKDPAHPMLAAVVVVGTTEPDGLALPPAR
ncbi:MAG: hypothetical protein HY904_16705 [Deltaproteobacteria bacterium]|nr:hypothetical protein [Deltaproteobacteria bacterium]